MQNAEINVGEWIENLEDEYSVQNNVIMGDGERHLIQPFSANVQRGICIERRQKFIGVGRHHKVGQSSPGAIDFTFKCFLRVPVFSIFQCPTSDHFNITRNLSNCDIYCTILLSYIDQLQN